MQLPQVRQAAVLAHKDARGQVRLAAYVVPASGVPAPAEADSITTAESGSATSAEPGSATPAEALRSALALRLPEHMLPQAYTFLTALPITPNGKLDRRALPAPDFAAAQRDYAAPAGHLLLAYVDGALAGCGALSTPRHQGCSSGPWAGSTGAPSCGSSSGVTPLKRPREARSISPRRRVVFSGLSGSAVVSSSARRSTR